MNPESPYHFIYTDYINNKELLNEGIVKVWHFNLDDNLHLSEKYKEELKRVNRKSKVSYKRNILGEWVIAEGKNEVTLREAEDRVRQAESDQRKYLRLTRTQKRDSNDLAIANAEAALATAKKNYSDKKYDIAHSGVTDEAARKANENELKNLQNKIESSENSLNPSTIGKTPVKDRRAVTLEIGTQNSGLGLLLLFNTGIFPPEVAKGGMVFVTAWWGVWHIVSGLILGTVFRFTGFDTGELSKFLHKK